MGITIITDSGSDIKQKTAAKWGIRVLPLMVRFGEEVSEKRSFWTM